MLDTIITVVTKLLPVAGSIIGVVEQIYGDGKGKIKKDSYLNGVLAALAQYFPPELLTDSVFIEKIGKLADVIIDIANYIDSKRGES